MDNKRIKAIKSDSDYQDMLVLLEELIDNEPDAGTSLAEQIDILASLIKAYEDEKFTIEAPDAIEAIKFVMEQRNLEQKDLIPFIGTKGRVSEVLSGKRNLSIDMIRSLENGLGIPSRALLKKPSGSNEITYETWDKKVFDEMKNRGYFDGLVDSFKDKTDLLQSFFSSINHQTTVQALLKQASYRTSTTDKTALAAWTGYVIKQADKLVLDNVTFKTVDRTFLQEIAKLSSEQKGPLMVKDLLLTRGIKLIIEPAFPKTYIDGATIFTEQNPIIGLTLRLDRLDNFWFVLMHELSHILLHSDDEKIDVFYDEVSESEETNLTNQEVEADALAVESLVPFSIWENSAAHLVPSDITFNLLANQLRIHPAIIAGKYRHETKNWKIFSDVVRDNKIKYLFETRV